MADPRNHDPREGERLDHPGHPDAPPPYSDPAADPRLANSDLPRADGGKTGLVAAGIIAALLVIALIAFSTGPATDPGTTAVIPDQTDEFSAPAEPEMDLAPAPEADPAAPTETIIE